MKREIKFRAWDKKLKKMWDWESLYDWEMQLFNEDEAKFHGVVYMQFTNLKDKHGKEIFEKDIVNENGIVEFIGGKFLICYTDGGCEDLMGEEDEIFGNIFENPELLTVAEE